MVIYEDSKRVCARAICFIDDKVILMKRHREVGQPLGDYYVIPGGGVEEGEEKELAAIRELDEETCVKAEILEFLEREDYGTGICYWYLSRYISGEPELGGEEKELNSPENHYEVVTVPVEDIDSYTIPGHGKKLVKNAYKILKDRY